ncbi:MAG: polysulfide reductase NrfD [Chloroflexi bacterium]|nr:polysulfide reductase NrfD [Chloroflexota bacterium]MCI0577052.1 polysulfide reductase NrfD [Chloroflexota bacterium]MCI0643522.1 polysulfide reductase NrfD [Chloroflexota bacterium]MCI0728132.1 polysulfide reductase NrfD [Chloroflexota bacterium]
MPGELQIPQWEWWIVLYFFAGGIAGGAYLVSSVIELVGEEADRPIARMGYIIAFAMLPICVLALILDLGQPLRFWHMVLYSKTFLPWPVWDSPMSVGAYALLVFGLFSTLSFLDVLVETGRLRWAPFRLKYSSTPRMIYAMLGGIAAFFLASYTGVLLATTHLPAWANTPLLGALFLASGASTGVAAVVLGLALAGTDVGASLGKLKRLDTVAMVLELVLLVALLVWLGSAASTLLSGVNGILLIGGVLLIGLLVPLVMQLRPGLQGMKETTRMTAVTAVLILIGGFILRTVIVMGGQGFW